MMSIQIDFSDPRYLKRDLANEEVKVLQQVLDGKVITLPNGKPFKTDWNKRQKYGNHDNKYGLCNVVVGNRHKQKKRIKKNIGISFDEKVKEWEPAQIAWSIEHKYIQHSRSMGNDGNSQQTSFALTISHKCNRHNCINIKHLELIPSTQNLKRCICHEQLENLNYVKKFTSDQQAFEISESCTCFNGRCFMNLKKYPIKKI